MNTSHFIQSLILVSLLVLPIGGCDKAEDTTGNEDTTTGPGDTTEPDDTLTTPDSDTPPVEKTLVINEIAAANQHGPDWVELFNAGEESINLTGWSLTDNLAEHITGLPLNIEIAPGEYLLLQGGSDGDFTFGLGSEDSLFLYGAGGGIIDETSWGQSDAPAGTTWGRYPNGSGDFGTLSFPTPGSENMLEGEAQCDNGIIEGNEKCDGELLSNVSCENLGYSGGVLSCAADCLSFDTDGCTMPPAGIVINEVTSSEDDFIELFNNGDDPVDLSGWSVTDKSPETEGHSYLFPDDTIVDSGDYLLLTKGTEHLFGLSSNDKVQLFDAEGALYDNANYGNNEAAISYCRTPNGTGIFSSCEEATPGASND